MVPQVLLLKLLLNLLLKKLALLQLPAEVVVEVIVNHQQHRIEQELQAEFHQAEK